MAFGTPFWPSKTGLFGNNGNRRIEGVVLEMIIRERAVADGCR